MVKIDRIEHSIEMPEGVSASLDGGIMIHN